MNLSTSLKNHFNIVLILILVMGILAVTFFFTLSDAIEVILKENYQSLQATSQMLDSIERQNNYLMARAMDAKDPVSNFLHMDENFRKQLAIAEKNITIPGEDMIIKDIHSSYVEFVKTVHEFEKLIEKDEKWLFYQNNIQRLFWEVKKEINILVNINQEEMLKSDVKAGKMARNYSMIMAIIGIIGMLILTFYSKKISRTFVSSLSKLSVMTRKMAHGDYSMRLSNIGNDEMSFLASEINRLLDTIQSRKDSFNTEAINKKQLSSALMELIEEPAVIFNSLNEPLLSNTAGRLIFTGISGNENINRMRSSIEDSSNVILNDIEYRLETKPMITASRKSMGILVKLIQV